MTLLLATKANKFPHRSAKGGAGSFNHRSVFLREIKSRKEVNQDFVFGLNQFHNRQK